MSAQLPLVFALIRAHSPEPLGSLLADHVGKPGALASGFVGHPSAASPGVKPATWNRRAARGARGG